MACPRCGNGDVRVGKITLVGDRPEIVAGVQADSIVVHSCFCSKCHLLEEASSADPAALERLMQNLLFWEGGSELQTNVAWGETGDREQPFAAQVQGHQWRLRRNDYPRQERYTLLIDGVECARFSHWPISWISPEKTGS